MKKNEKGFTLVELIVVIVILAILVGVTILGATKWVATSRKNQDLNNAKSIESLLNAQFVSGDYWNSPEFRAEMKRLGWVCGNSNAYPDVNNGNSLYIMKWNDFTYEQFQTDPAYAEFPTSYYRAINCEENRAWFVWRWLSYNSEECGSKTQTVIDGIPVAQQAGYCFYIMIFFDENHFAHHIEVVCAPEELLAGSTWDSPDTYYNIQNYKVNGD